MSKKILPLFPQKNKVLPLIKLKDSKKNSRYEITYTLLIEKLNENCYEIGFRENHRDGFSYVFNQYTTPEFNKLLQDAGFALSEFSLKN